MEEMNTQQIKALELYLSSANFEGDYKPITFSELSKSLAKEKIEVSKSTLNRWCEKFEWKKRLELKVQEIMISDKDKNMGKKALTHAVGRTMDLFEVNRKLQEDGYSVLQSFVDKVKEDISHGKMVREDIKLVATIQSLTTGRDDKMFDRLAAAGGEKVNSEDVMRELGNIELIMDDDTIDIELEDLEEDYEDEE